MRRVMKLFSDVFFLTNSLVLRPLNRDRRGEREAKAWQSEEGEPHDCKCHYKQGCKP